MGTCFLATPESPVLAAHKQAILDAQPGTTEASGIFDILWGNAWPGVQVRAIQNRFTARWVGREDELLAVIEEVRRERDRTGADEDPHEMSLLAGEGARRIRDITPAGQVVRDIVAEAERILR